MKIVSGTIFLLQNVINFISSFPADWIYCIVCEIDACQLYTLLLYTKRRHEMTTWARRRGVGW